MPSIIDFLFPPQCILCQTETMDAQALCGECWAELRFSAGHACIKCGMSLAHINVSILQHPLLCSPCLSERHMLDEIRSLTRYEGTARALILKLKHRDQLHIAHYFAHLSMTYYDRYIQGADIIVPVPLHWMRRLKRKTNQSAEIARILSRDCNIPMFPEYMRREKSTVAMKNLSRAQRQKNVYSAFKIDPRYVASIAHKKILLIDDVMTTGATLNEMARLFKKAGASCVIALVMARAYIS